MRLPSFLLDNLIQMVLEAISPPLREFFKNSLREAWAHAQATPNPIDDIIVKAIANLLGFDVQDLTPPGA